MLTKSPLLPRRLLSSPLSVVLSGDLAPPPFQSPLLPYVYSPALLIRPVFLRRLTPLVLCLPDFSCYLGVFS